MIVIPIQFIIALVLAGIGVILLIVSNTTRFIYKTIIKWKRKHNRKGEENEN